METLCLTAKDIDRAAYLLKEGKLVAFPTETVYGLGAPIFQPQAIARIFSVKKRPNDNPLIAHISDLGQLSQIAVSIPDLFYSIADVFFPGPLTVVLKKHSNVPAVVSAGLESIAVRMPDHSLARALIECVGEPLVAPSANLSGKPSATQCRHVLEDFNGQIAAVIDGGKTEYGIESTVISLLGDVPVLLRPGAVSHREIEKVIGCALAQHSSGPNVSPGMQYRHYAPSTPIRLFDGLDELRVYMADHSTNRFMLLTQKEEISLPNAFILSTQELYSMFRLADEQGCDEILILCDQTLSTESALMNRIFRASRSFY